MIIHSDILTEQDIRECIPSGCYFAGHYDRHDNFGSVHTLGSRKRERAFSVRLSGSSTYNMDSRRLDGSHKSATWDEWGIFIARIYERDPEAVCGWYKTREDFMEFTRTEHERISQWRQDLLPTHRAPWLV